MANLRANKITGTEVFETTGSVQFDGSGDVLTVPNTVDFRLGSGDFTLECFMYYVGPLSSNRTLFGLFENSSARRSYQLEVRSTGVLRFEWWADGSTTNAIDSPASTITSGQWSHIAVVRNGSVITVYLNGSSVATSVVGTSSFFDNTVDSFRIGALNAAVDQSFSGHISNVRVLKGTALYTKNFTPPTRELTVIPNTVLLCCQSTTRANEERTGKTITVNGNAVANELTPGLLTDRVKSGGSSSISGSVEFNGTGSNYLSLASSSDFNLGTGDFTVECFVYLGDITSNAGYVGIFNRHNFSNSTGWGIWKETGGKFGFWYNAVTQINGTSNVATNQWYHIAAVRNGSTISLYVNGVLENSASNSSFNDASGPFGIGAADVGATWNSSYPVKGFISNLRVIKGTALYTQNFIPPTRELKNLPGTVLLCCQNSKSATQEATGKTITVNGNATARNFTPPVGFDGFVNFDGATKIKSQNYFYLPTGNTEDRGRGRGVFGGGTASPGSSNLNSIEYITIQTLGNATDFGDLTVATRTKGGGGVASYTRGITGGGFDSGNTNRIEYITFATTGNAVNFGGTLTTAGRNLASASNSVRGIFAGGDNRATVIDYLTIASTGTVSSFGSLPSPGRSNLSGCASQTRALFGGGYTAPAVLNTVEYVTIASTGNAVDFGDLTTARFDPGACSNSIRGIFAGGGTPTPTLFNIIDYITIASTGNATDFGDLIVVEQNPAGTSSQTRGVFAGGQSAYVNTIQYITITSTGNASDFGDLIVSRSQAFSCSDSHGGLG